MSMEVKAIVLVVFTIAVGAFIFSYIKNYMGKAVRGVLHIPQGKNQLEVDVFNDESLKPYKFAQVFEVQVLADEQTMSDERTGETHTGTGALSYKNKPFGFTDASSNYTKALAILAHKHKKVFARAVITSTNSEGRPIVQLELPDEYWFAKALKAKQY